MNVAPDAEFPPIYSFFRNEESEIGGCTCAQRDTHPWDIPQNCFAKVQVGPRETSFQSLLLRYPPPWKSSKNLPSRSLSPVSLSTLNAFSADNLNAFPSSAPTLLVTLVPGRASRARLFCTLIQPQSYY